MVWVLDRFVLQRQAKLQDASYSKSMNIGMHTNATLGWNALSVVYILTQLFTSKAILRGAIAVIAADGRKNTSELQLCH